MTKQTFKVGNRNLTVDQMRAYRQGKFDPTHMKFIDTNEQIEALRSVEKDAGLSTQPDEIKTSLQPSTEPVEASEEPIESEFVSELEKNHKLRTRFEELKEIGYVNLKGKDKEEYKTLKSELDL